VTSPSDFLKTLYPIGLLDDGHERVEEMRIPVHGPSAQYAITLFEGLMGYPIDGGSAIGIVALREHFRRLLDGAMKSDLGFDRDPAKLERLIWRSMDEIENLILINGVKGPVYIRPTLYHDGTGNVCLGPALEGDIHLAVYLQKWDGYLAAKPEGQQVLISPYLKAASPVAHLKCSANYGLGIPVKKEARRQGYDEVIFRDEHLRIAEASSQNVIADLGGRLVTPDHEGLDGRPSPVLPGITLRILRETVAPSLGLEIVEDAIHPEALFGPACEGIALCGTASEVRHVGALSAKSGPASTARRAFDGPSAPLRALMEGYARLTRGEAYREWLTVIPL